jgi:hypothetical protein
MAFNHHQDAAVSCPVLSEQLADCGYVAMREAYAARVGQ